MAAICVRAGISEHSFESSISIETRTGMTNSLSLAYFADGRAKVGQTTLSAPAYVSHRGLSLPEKYPGTKRFFRKKGEVRWKLLLRGKRISRVERHLGGSSSYVGGSIGERISFHGYPDLKYSPFHRGCQ